MSTAIQERQIRSTAHWAGWFYLLILVSGIAAEFFVRSTLFVGGDPAATAMNIIASPAALRWGILADIVMIISDIVVSILGGDSYLSVIPAGQINALALFFAELHGTGYALALLFFAVSLVLVGLLIIRSSRFPKLLGVMLIIAALGYVSDTLARTILVSYDQVASIFDTAVFLPAFVAELAMVLYLIIRGVRPTPQTGGREA